MPRSIWMLVLTACAPLLGGCAGLGDSMASSAFVDPARYDLFDCKRLEGERASLDTRIAAQQALIDKAKTGAAGTIVGEAVYRNEYIAMRAQAKLANEAWARNRCDAPQPAAGIAPLPPAKPAR